MLILGKKWNKREPIKLPICVVVVQFYSFTLYLIRLTHKISVSLQELYTFRILKMLKVLRNNKIISHLASGGNLIDSLEILP
jgi:hypothetical protein